MKKNTFEAYKKEIQTKYELVIQEEYSGLLTSPAVMRDLCLSLINEGLSINDEKIFRNFFELNSNDDLRKAITNCTIALFKPIRSFLRGENNTDNLMRIELAAILVNFQPRPYTKYAKISSEKEVEVIDELETKMDKISFEGDLNQSIILKKTPSISKHKNHFNLKKAGMVGVGVLVLVFGFFIQRNYFPQKQCMEWVKDHYEAVDCHEEQLGFMTSSSIVPINENTMQLKKLDCKQKLLFFKNEKPLIWYFKFDSTVELYNGPGFHPLTGKPLKPITGYMINKYNLANK